MAALGQQTVIFNNFAQGEIGLQGSYNIGFGLYRGHLLYRGWFTGQNVMRYTNGMVGPISAPISNTMVGPPLALSPGLFFMFKVGVVNAPAIVANEDNARVFNGATNPNFGDGSTNTWNLVGRMTNLGGLGTYRFGQVTLGTNTYITITDPADASPGIAVWDHVAQTLTPLAGSPFAGSIAIYGSQIVAGGTDFFGHQLWFSASPSDPGAPAFGESWPATNFINIGAPPAPTAPLQSIPNALGTISGLYPMRNFLVITKNDGTIWILTGTPGVNSVLRQVLVDMPIKMNSGNILNGQTIICALDDGLAAEFDGRKITPLRYLDINSVHGALSIVQRSVGSTADLADAPDWMFASDNAGGAGGPVTIARVHRAGTWNTMNFPFAICSNGLQPFVFPDTRVAMCDTPGNPVHTWQPYTQRPPFISDIGGAAGIPDPSTVIFTLPEFWDRTGTEIKVRAVLLDFTKWDTGDLNPNLLNMNVTCFRTAGLSHIANPTAGPVDDGLDGKTDVWRWSEIPSKASSSGTRQRATVTFDQDFGNGFQISFTNMRGVAIEKLVVILATREIGNI